MKILQQLRDRHSFVVPPQWCSHQATILAWPFNSAGQWLVDIESVRKEFLEFVLSVAHDEKVFLLLADDESRSSAVTALGPWSEGASVELVTVPLDDVWCRDSMPIFLSDGYEILPVDWRFNAWGGKFPFENDEQSGRRFLKAIDCPACVDLAVILEGGSVEVSDRGFGLTTKSCVLTKTRNPKLAQGDLDHVIKKYFGLRHLEWLEAGFVEGDHTDGHIDMVARCAPDGVILVNEAREGDPNYFSFRDNILQLEKMAPSFDAKVVQVPLPDRVIAQKDFKGETVRTPANYCNFYATSKSILVPTFNDPSDVKALAVIASAFPNHTVKGLHALSILLGGGGLFNCLAQQIPAGNFIDWEGIE